ncbi:hypothetical protein [Hyphomonas sp.]|uniref:hypothetical protein n=1 Tax=Hyphomonas sp. TaxID=87 RepID=UPI0025C3D8FA|nr:hypothetical protein [Hyphomonas sp.]
MTDKKEVEAATGQPEGIPPVVENLLGLELYADTALFFAHKNGNVSIQLTSLRFDNGDKGAAKWVTVGRLVMPIAGAQALSAGLFDYLKSHGLTPEIDPKNSN